MSRSSKGAALAAVVIAGPLLFAIVALMAMLFGAAAGWLAGLIFPQVFDRLTALIFGDPIPAWQFGAMLGFIGGFLRASIPNRK